MNIILKKNIADYVGGFVSDEHYINTKHLNEYSASIKYKQNRINSYINISGGVGDREYREKSQTYYSDETWSKKHAKTVSNDYITSRGGIDVDLTDRLTVGASVGYIKFRPDEILDEKTTIENNTSFTSSFVGLGYSDISMNRTNANLHIDKKFGKYDGEMNFDVDYMSYQFVLEDEFQTNYSHLFGYDRNQNTDVDIYSTKLDFYIPNEKVWANAGGAFSFATTDNQVNLNFNSPPKEQYDDFMYKETTAALYADITFPIGSKIYTKLGWNCHLKWDKRLSSIYNLNIFN